MARQLRRRNKGKGRGRTRRTIGDGGYEAVDGDGRIEHHLRPNGLLAHNLLHGVVRKRERRRDGARVCAPPREPGRTTEDVRVGRRACDRDADVIVNAGHFLVVRDR